MERKSFSDLSVAQGVDSSGNPTDIQSATVTISGAPVSGEDVLAFTDQNGITGVLGTGAQTTLTLSATSPFPTTAVWEQALESVTYENISDAPSLNTRVWILALPILRQVLAARVQRFQLRASMMPQ